MSAINKVLPKSQFPPMHSLPVILDTLLWTKNCHFPANPPPFLPKTPSVLATNLIKSYFEAGLVKAARTLFDEMPERDVVAWTAMIAGYASCNRHTHAWAVFREMKSLGVDPNAYTLSSALKACKGMGSLLCGALVHGLVVKRGLNGSLYVDNALMDLYATCCVTMAEACAVFRRIIVRNAVSWTTLITGYTHRGDGLSGLRVFRQMLSEESEPNPFSFSIAVTACASTGSQALGKQIHSVVTKNGLMSNLPVMNSILDMYCKCGSLSLADRCFSEMSKRDLITWNTLIAGHERSDSIDSLHIFSQMEAEGFTPNCFTLTSVMAACANFAILHCGQQVHGEIILRGLESNLALANALVDMYAKCGKIADSCNVFGKMSCRDLVSWTSMMIGYGMHGYGKEAVQLFDEMISSGTKPDVIVFMAVLSACSHAGLVDEGLRYFRSMVSSYNITPNQEIFGCVVDLLGRAGRLEEAYELIESMPFKPDESVWGAFLGACKAHKLSFLGKLKAQGILDLRPNMVGTYVMLSNIYAANGKWAEFAKLRKLMRGMGTKKEAGRSWVEVRDQVYSFVVADKAGSHITCTYGVLEILGQHMKDMRYVADFNCVIDDLEDGP